MQLTRGSGPFCSWTRLAGRALLIWGDRAKSGERPGRRRDLAKNTPRYGSKNDKVTRWPKRHNTSQNGKLWVPEVNQPPNMPGSAVAAQHGVFSASGLVNAVGSRNQHFRDGGNSSRLRLRPDGPGPVIHQITSVMTGRDRLTGNTIPPSTNSGETMRHHHAGRHVQRCQPNPSCSSQIARTQGRPLPFHAGLSQTMGLVSVFCTMCRK